MTARTTVRRRWLPVSLLVIAPVLVALGVVLLVRADHLRNSGPAANKAITDRGATSQVVGQVTTGLNQVLTYDYAKPQTNQAAAKRWLSGDATTQYRTLFAQLQKKLGPKEKLDLVTKVHTAGVMSLKHDTAQLLVFLDQQSTRSTDKASSVAAAQVLITANRHGSTWTITELRPI